MTYGFVMDVPAPIELYDALHAEIGRRSEGRDDGLLLHLGRATDDGFQVLEIWESKEHCDRYDAEVVAPALAELADGQPAAQPAKQEFEPRGLVIPGAAVRV
ncbi:hypothetical protein [Modestobacter marinus]|uniref:hypothetical protein n=1 Tax=Modestobacter marinus TaxID=477641 RepID=UPI001C947958|nr:hypothetical protein [Modestobacter marinus]